MVNAFLRSPLISPENQLIFGFHHWPLGQFDTVLSKLLGLPRECQIYLRGTSGHIPQCWSQQSPEECSSSLLSFCLLEPHCPFQRPEAFLLQPSVYSDQKHQSQGWQVLQDQQQKVGVPTPKGQHCPFSLPLSPPCCHFQSAVRTVVHTSRQEKAMV